MNPLGHDVLNILNHDGDAREVILRQIIMDRLGTNPPPRLDDAIVATYFLSLRTWDLKHAAKEIAYHATSGIKDPPAGSLLAQCTAKEAGYEAFDALNQLGLLHVAFPLKMMLQPDGHLTSTDILHTVAGAVLFDVYENRDSRLVALQIPDHVIRTFPGPAHGPERLRARTNYAADEPVFGTILKPTAGITADDVGRLMEQVAASPLLMFVKEDEDLYPRLDYSPVHRRAREAMAAIERVRDRRGGKGIVFAPHITSSPHELLDTLHAVLDEGVTGVMFSETYSGGTVRMVREATKHLPNPPAIYGHNAGIGTKTRCIYREVVDFLARLDGIDFRQTAPVRPGMPFIRPYGLEWEASEDALTRAVPGIKPTMITRAGALDQGNLILNLLDAEKRGRISQILFLAGSAINSAKNASGVTDPMIGLEAMQQAIEIHRGGQLRDVPIDEHLRALAAIADQPGHAELKLALRQRYPELKG